MDYEFRVIFFVVVWNENYISGPMVRCLFLFGYFKEFRRLFNVGGQETPSLVSIVASKTPEARADARV